MIYVLYHYIWANFGENKIFSIKSTKPIDKVGNVWYYELNKDEG